MPNIFDYDAGNIGTSPNDRASAAHVTAGRRIAQNYNEAGAAYQQIGHEAGSTIAQLGKTYVDYQAHKEISAGGLAASSLALAATNKWNDTIKDPNTDPNDPSLQSKFLNEVEPQLQRLRESMTTEKGREWADHHINTIREHLVNTTTADMSTMAGVAAHNNAVQGLNNLSGMVDKDPHAIGIASDLWDTQIKALAESSPNMKGAQALKFQTEAKQKGMEQLVKAAVESSIRRGGDGTEISDDPKYAPYINAAERQRFIQDQRREERFARSEERAQKAWEKEQAQFKSDNTVVALRKRMGPDAEGGPVSREDVHKLEEAGELTRRDLEHVINLQEHYNREPPPSAASAETYRVTIDQVRKGDIKTLGPIWALESQGKLTRQDSDRLQKAVMDMKTDAGSSLQQEKHHFLEGVKNQINKSIFGALYQGGSAKSYEFERALDRKMEEYRKAGKDPHDLLDPEKPDYMGQQKVLNQYITPLDQDLRKVIEDAAKVGKRPPLSNFSK